MQNTEFFTNIILFSTSGIKHYYSIKKVNCYLDENVQYILTRESCKPDDLQSPLFPEFFICKQAGLAQFM